LWFEEVKVLAMWWIGAGMCVTMLTIFLLGMLRTSQIAWDTAWRMFTVYTAVGAGLMLATYAVYQCLHRRRKLRHS
jgi:carbon starvation protein CstA